MGAAPKKRGIVRRGCRLTTIYMPLEGEGTDVWVPVEAHDLGAGRFRVRGSMPADQLWRFPPGTLVRTRHRRFADGTEGLEAIDRSN